MLSSRNEREREGEKEGEKEREKERERESYCIVPFYNNSLADFDIFHANLVKLFMLCSL